MEARVEDEGCPFSIKQFYEMFKVRKSSADLTYTNELPPIFVDSFWEAVQTIRAWNYHMKKTFSAF